MSSFADDFSSFWSSPASSVRWDNLKSSLPPTIHQHVKNVYMNLAVMLAISAIGAWLDMTGLLSGGTWSGLLCLGGLLVFSFMPATPSNENTRKWLLYGFALGKGLSLGPLLTYSLYINPRIIITALTGTSIIFGCFTLSVITSPQRNVFYTRGIMSTALMVLLGTSLVNMFLGSRVLFNVELYLGLMVFAGFIVYDTQLMIAKAELGSRDYLRHSMELYLDVVAIFVRLLIILQKREREREEKKRKNERRRW